MDFGQHLMSPPTILPQASQGLDKSTITGNGYEMLKTKVTVGVLGVWHPPQSFLSRISKDGRIVISKLLFVFVLVVVGVFVCSLLL